MIRWFFGLCLFRHSLSRFKWYRRWHGGRWENHYVEICASFIWLDIAGPGWPAERPVATYGRPEVEDWPVRSK